MNWLKKWLFDGAKKRFADAATHSDQKKIGILMDAPEERLLLQIHQYFNQKGIEKNQLEMLFFSENKPAETTGFSGYNRKEIKWAGYAFNDAIKSFLSHDFGRLYYLYSTFEPHQALILEHCQAMFKVGMYREGIEPLLDLTIDDKVSSAVEAVKLIDDWIQKISSHEK